MENNSSGELNGKLNRDLKTNEEQSIPNSREPASLLNVQDPPSYDQVAKTVINNSQLHKTEVANNLINMVKQNGTDVDADDGAQEKMLKDGVKVTITPTKYKTEVKIYKYIYFLFI